MHPVHGEGYEDLAGELEDLIASDGLSGDSLADACEELERLDAADDAADRVLDCMEGLARGLSVRRGEEPEPEGWMDRTEPINRISGFLTARSTRPTPNPDGHGYG